MSLTVANAHRRTRTYNPLIKSQCNSRPKPSPYHTNQTISEPFSLHLPYGSEGLPPDLASVLAAWPHLSGAIRSRVTAMIQAALLQRRGPMDS